MRKSRTGKISAFIICGLLILSCHPLPLFAQSSYPQQSFEQALESEIDQLLPFDVRFVPEIQQVDSQIHESSNFQQVSKLFQNESSVDIHLTKAKVSINSSIFYEGILSTSPSELPLMLEEGNEGLLLLHVSITNISEEAIYIPENFLDVSIKPSNHFLLSQMDLYPLEFGYLDTILEADKRFIEPEQTAEGYLIYQLAPMDFFATKSQGYLYLNLKELDQIEELAQLDTGNYQHHIVLPMNELVKDRIDLAQNFIQDRVSREWWGDKSMIVEDSQHNLLSHQGLQIQVKKIEVTDLIVRPDYQGIFEEFPKGQLLVSVLLEINNTGSERLLAYLDQFEFDLRMGDSLLVSEPLLENGDNPIFIGPKQREELIKVFVLDKEVYQREWQRQDFQFEGRLPIRYYDVSEEINKGLMSILSGSFIRQELGLSMKSSQGVATFNYIWSPEKLYYLNTHLDWVKP